MSIDVYKFDIGRADRARDLHQLTQDINEDDMLDAGEKAGLHRLIREKFGRLNHAANPNPKPRW